MEIFIIIMAIVMFVWFVQAMVFLFGFFVAYERCTTEQQEDVVRNEWKPFVNWFQVTNVTMILMFIIFLIILGNIK